MELKISNFCFNVLSDMAGLACAYHPIFYLGPSTSLPAAPLFSKNVSNNYG